jgi:hypothetical protein
LTLAGPVASYELTDSREELCGDLINSLGVVFEGGFILRHGFVFRLLLVMVEQPANALFVPGRSPRQTRL